MELSLWPPRLTFGKANRVARTGDDYAYVTVTRRDEYSTTRSLSATNPEVAAFLNRLRGQVMTCALVNASVCARNPVRLYKRAKGPSKGTKQVDRKTMAHLASGKAGVKAATWAEQDGGVVEVTRHDVLDMLTRPNPYDTGGEFWELQYLFKMIGGHAVEWYEPGPDGRPVFAWSLLPQHTIVIRDDEDYITGYSYGREGAKVMEFAADETLLLKNRLNPWDPFSGLSNLHGLLEEVDLDAANIEFDLDFVKHGQTPPFVMSLPQDASDDQVKAAEGKLRNNHSGLLGKMIGLVVREATITPLNIAPRELQSEEMKERINRAIRLRFGHTDSMYDSNTSTRAAAIVGYSEQFLGGTIAPMVNRDAEQRTEKMLPMFDLEPGEYFLAADDPVSHNVSEEEEATRQDVASGIMTINEARQARGLDEVDEGGVLRVNGVPLDKVGQQPIGGIPVSFTGGGVPVTGLGKSLECGDGTADSQDAYSTVTDAAGKSVPDADDQDCRRVRASGAECDLGGSPLRPERRGDRDGGRKDGDPEPGPGDRDYRSRIRQLADDVLPGCCSDTKDLPAPAWIDEATERELRPLLEGYLRDVSDAVIEANGAPTAATLNQLRAQLDGELRPILSAALARSAAAAMDDLGMAADADDFVPQYAVDFLDTHVPQLTGEITTSLAEEVGGVVQDGLREGATTAEIAKEIEASGFEKPRAERIARTEVQIASQEGKLAGWREVGVEKKEWQLAPGNCPMCQGIHDRLKDAGGVVPIDGLFARAGETINGQKVPWDVRMAPAHPNCRCNVLAVLGGE